MKREVFADYPTLAVLTQVITTRIIYVTDGFLSGLSTDSNNLRLSSPNSIVHSIRALSNRLVFRSVFRVNLFGCVKTTVLRLPQIFELTEG